MHAQVRACSKHSSFSLSVSMRDYYYYMIHDFFSEIQLSGHRHLESVDREGQGNSGKPLQGTLTEGKGSVQLTSLFKKKEIYIFCVKNS